MASSQDRNDGVDDTAASLGGAQSSNPPADPEYLEDDATPVDADVDPHGDGRPPADERPTPDDPAPGAP